METMMGELQRGDPFRARLQDQLLSTQRELLDFLLSDSPALLLLNQNLHRAPTAHGAVAHSRRPNPKVKRLVRKVCLLKSFPPSFPLLDFREDRCSGFSLALLVLVACRFSAVRTYERMHVCML